jgi:isocitrate lyase
MQVVQQVKARLKAIYLSGWQVAADANTAGQTYPDQSLYPVDSVPATVRRINAALRRCDQIARWRATPPPAPWPPSSPTPRPASAAPSTPTNSCAP